MDRVGIRELRNQVASVVRRAGDGERIVITVDGRPVAQLGPIEPTAEPTIDDLIAAGCVVAPALAALPDQPEPVDCQSMFDQATRSTSCADVGH